MCIYMFVDKYVLIYVNIFTYTDSFTFRYSCVQLTSLPSRFPVWQKISNWRLGFSSRLIFLVFFFWHLTCIDYNVLNRRENMQNTVFGPKAKTLFLHLVCLFLFVTSGAAHIMNIWQCRRKDNFSSVAGSSKYSEYGYEFFSAVLLPLWQHLPRLFRKW
jgi:hypothetical protein